MRLNRDRGRSDAEHMPELRVVGPDVHAETIAGAVAESAREVRNLGGTSNRAELGPARAATASRLIGGMPQNWRAVIGPES